jgi:hypothetical protein
MTRLRLRLGVAQPHKPKAKRARLVRHSSKGDDGRSPQGEDGAARSIHSQETAR